MQWHSLESPEVRASVYRARVIGGWLVCTVSDAAANTVFVPDPEGSWRLFDLLVISGSNAAKRDSVMAVLRPFLDADRQLANAQLEGALYAGERVTALKGADEAVAQRVRSDLEKLDVEVEFLELL